MNNEIRLSLSGAREDDSQPLHIATEGSLNQLPTKHRKGWTPAPTKPAYSQTNVSLAHKGRDIESLMRYHEAHKKGVTDDDALRAKYGSVTCAKCGMASVGVHYCTTGQPTPTPVASAPTPLQSADAPWPKCALSPSSERQGLSVVFIQTEAGGATTAYYTDGTTGTYRTSNGVLAFGAVCTDAGAIVRALEQNSHEDAAAQLRGKAATAQTVAARAWQHDGGHALYVEAPSGCYYYGMTDSWEAFNWPKAKESTLWSETFGPERDAIIAECCAAMNLDPKTGEPLHA